MQRNVESWQTLLSANTKTCDWYFAESAPTTGKSFLENGHSEVCDRIRMRKRTSNRHPPAVKKQLDRRPKEASLKRYQTKRSNPNGTFCYSLPTHLRRLLKEPLVSIRRSWPRRGHATGSTHPGTTPLSPQSYSSRRANPSHTTTSGMNPLIVPTMRTIVTLCPNTRRHAAHPHAPGARRSEQQSSEKRETRRAAVDKKKR